MVMARGQHIFGYHAWYNAVNPNRTGAGRMTGRLGYGVSMYPDPETVAAAMWFVGKELNDWRSVWTQIAPMIRSELVASLKSGHGPEHESWHPLAPKYVRRKAHNGYSTAQLYRTGRLAASLADASNTRFTKTRLKTGTDLPYARAMQFGYSGMSKSMARQYMGTTGRGDVEGRVAKMREAAGAWPRPFVGVTAGMREKSADAMRQRANELIQMAVDKMNTGAPAGETGRATSAHILKAYRTSKAGGGK